MKKIPGVAFVADWFDAAGISYFFQHYVRVLSAEPKFCEMLFLAGPPKNGKDAMAARFEKRVGNVDEGEMGFCGVLRLIRCRCRLEHPLSGATPRRTRRSPTASSAPGAPSSRSSSETS